MRDTEKYRNSDLPIHVVYVYLMDEFNTCYVGRTKNLHNRDLAHRRGRKHSDGKITYDSLYQFCIDNNLSIPAPVIKEENLTGIESLEREDYWVSYYRNNGWNVLNKAKTGINHGSLGRTVIWTYETCKEECKKYHTRTELKNESYGCYEVCLENGWLDEFGVGFAKHPDGFWNIKKNVIDEASKYKTISDFIISSGGAYNAAKKNNWLDDLPFLKPILAESSDIIAEYKKLGNINDTLKKFKISYRTFVKICNENGYKIGNHNRKDPLPEEIPMIEQLLKDGVSQREIERRFNITRKRLKKIFNT